MAQDLLPASRASRAACTALVIGRWQLPHRGHVRLLHEALKLSDDVLIAIGSAFRSRDARNPFTWMERKAMLLASLTEAQRACVRFLPIRDYGDDDRWNAKLAELVQGAGARSQVVVVGHEKDASSYYLRNLPWQVVRVEEKFEDLDATALRDVYFGATSLEAALQVLEPCVAPGTLAYLQAWAKLPPYRMLQEQHAAVQPYQSQWGKGPFLTADALVRVNTPQGARVLMVRRGGVFGRNLLALPGGFVEPGERFFQAALRELFEETGLNLWIEQAKACFRGTLTLDAPERSVRGRIVSQVHYFDLGDHKTPPEVRREGSSDAIAASWPLLAEIGEHQESVFEDHILAIEHFCGHFE